MPPRRAMALRFGRGRSVILDCHRRKENSAWKNRNRQSADAAPDRRADNPLISTLPKGRYPTRAMTRLWCAASIYRSKPLHARAASECALYASRSKRRRDGGWVVGRVERSRKSRLSCEVDYVSRCYGGEDRVREPREGSDSRPGVGVPAKDRIKLVPTRRAVDSIRSA